MASSPDCLEYVLSLLPPENIRYRRMMGEYLLYYKGKLVGGIYDDRLLVKPTAAARAYMPDAEIDLPYDGAKPMLSVAEPDTPDYLTGLFEAMYSEL